MTGTNHKLRSIVLTVLVLVSTFGATVTLSGAAAAANQSGPPELRTATHYETTDGRPVLELAFSEDLAAPNGDESVVLQFEDGDTLDLSDRVRLDSDAPARVEVSMPGHYTNVSNVTVAGFEDRDDGATMAGNGTTFSVTTAVTTVSLAASGETDVYQSETVALVANGTQSELTLRGPSGSWKRATGVGSETVVVDTADLSLGNYSVTSGAGSTSNLTVRALALEITPDTTSLVADEDLTGAIAAADVQRSIEVSLLNDSGAVVTSETVRTDGNGTVEYNLSSIQALGAAPGNYTVEARDIEAGVVASTGEITVVPEKVTDLTVHSSENETVSVPEQGARTVDLAINVSHLNEIESGSPVSFEIRAGDDLAFTDDSTFNDDLVFTDVGDMQISGAGTVESSASVDNGTIKFTLNHTAPDYDPGTITVRNATLSGKEVTYPYEASNLTVEVRDSGGVNFWFTSIDALEVTETADPTGTPQFVETPTLSDADGDGTLSPGENVTLTATVGQPVPPNSATINIENVSDASEAIDGDATPRTSNLSMGPHGIYFGVQFEEPRDVDAIEYTFANEPPEQMHTFLEAGGKMVEPTDRTVRVDKSVENASAISFLELADYSSQTKLSITDVTVYENGSAVDESNWSAYISESVRGDLKPAMGNETKTWTSPVPLGQNHHRLHIRLLDRHTITGVAIEHPNESYPPAIDIGPAGGVDIYRTYERNLTSRDSVVSIPATSASIVNVYEDAANGSTPWTIEDLTILAAAPSNTKAVTVDAGRLGAGTVEATLTDNGTYVAEFQPDYQNITNGSANVSVTVTDGSGETRTAQSTSIPISEESTSASGSSELVFADGPTVADSNGDGTLRSGESLTLSGELRTKVQPDSVSASIGNQTTSHEGIDGDATPWTSDVPVGEQFMAFDGFFAQNRTVSRIEITFAGSPPEQFYVSPGNMSMIRSPSNNTVSVSLDNRTMANFFFIELDDSSETPLSVSDINAYGPDGQRIPESGWDPIFTVWYNANVTDEIVGPNTNWTSPKTIDSSRLDLTATYDQPQNISTILLEQTGTQYPSELSIQARGTNESSPFIENVRSSMKVQSSTTRIEIDPVRADEILFGEEDWDSGARWTVENISVLTNDLPEGTTVTIDATSIGAGTVDATVENGSISAQIDPDLSAVESGTYKLPVRVRNATGGVRTAQTVAVTVEAPSNDQTDDGNNDQTNENTDDSGSNDGNTDPAPSGAPSGGGAVSTGGDVGSVVDIEVVGGSVNASTIEAGDSVTINVTVRNAGNANGSEWIAVTAGDNRWLVNASVPSRETRTLTLERTLDQSGSYAIEAEGEQITTLTVATASTPTPTTTETVTETPTPTATETATPPGTTAETTTETPTATETTTVGAQTPTVTKTELGGGGGDQPDTTTTSGSGPLGIAPLLTALGVLFGVGRYRWRQ